MNEAAAAIEAARIAEVLRSYRNANDGNEAEGRAPVECSGTIAFIEAALARLVEAGTDEDRAQAFAITSQCTFG